MKKKLTLDKKTITQLSQKEQSQIVGGEAAWTTSFGSCTGWICCTPQPKITEVYTTCMSDQDPWRPDCNSQLTCDTIPTQDL